MERNLKLTLSISLFALVFLSVAFYAYRQSEEYLNGPILVITEPQDGASLNHSDIFIKGNAKNVSFLTLNGDTLFVDSKGVFVQKILLLPGYNLVTLTAQDRFGKKVEQKLQLIYKQDIKILETASSTAPLDNQEG